MANPPNTQNTYPLLSDVPAGPIRDSLRLLWDQMAATAAKIPPVVNILNTSAIELALTVDIGTLTTIQALVTWGEQVAAEGEHIREVWTVGQTFPERIFLPRSLGRAGGPSVWLALATLQWAASAAGDRTLEWILTTPAGVSVLTKDVRPGSVAPMNITMSALLIDPPGGAYLTLQATQSSGGGLNIEAAGTRMWLTRLL